MRTNKNFFLALMALPLFFAGCDKDDNDNKQPVSVVEDGFYVVGEATAIADLTADDAPKALMSAGINENNEQTVREGMYEKYVALEGGKTFSLVIKEGAKETKYGATLTLSDTLREGEQPAIKVYKGALTENGTLQVATSGLYHIVLDLNKDGSLSDKLILVAPVEWGVRGAMNGWKFTAFPAPAFSKTAMTYTLTESTVETAGAFKFAYGGGWKIELNTEATVKANTNLGAASADDTKKLKAGGSDIPIARAKYKIELTWTLEKGALGNSFSYAVTKTGDLAVLDPATFTYSLIGNAIYDATADTLSNWNYDADFTYTGKESNTYTYEIANVKLGTGGFKVRFGHDWGKSFGFTGQEGNVITLSTSGGDVSHASTATYAKAILTFDWVNDAETNIKLTLQP
ncbi:MAG: hypothetical protein LBO71_07290 [Prevotellaceae bacterium]|jgi:hypothetical protein|nr:hypothetical protein [Prevotellaceae bacterium]